MAQDEHTILRQSLDAVDRHRRRMFAGFTIVVIGMAIAQFRFGLAGTANDVPKMLTVVLVVLMLWISAMAIAIIVQLTKMTKMILRAIELATRPPAR
jgi:hypothetical protein